MWISNRCNYINIVVSRESSLLPRHLHDERYPDRRELRNLNHHVDLHQIDVMYTMHRIETGALVALCAELLTTIKLLLAGWTATVGNAPHPPGS